MRPQLQEVTRSLEIVAAGLEKRRQQELNGATIRPRLAKHVAAAKINDGHADFPNPRKEGVARDSQKEAFHDR